MPLPLPDFYSDWKDWARACLQFLQEGSTEVAAGGFAQGGLGNGNLVPTGYDPIWLDLNNLLLYGGNQFGTVPTAPDLFAIDTANLADAAIETNKIAPSAVVTDKIANAAILTAKIADAAILSAKIGDAQIVTAKIADLAVNNAKIANAAIDSVKIQDAAITRAKIALAAIGSAQIDNAVINTAHITNGSITNALIANAAVGTAHIQLAAITNALIANAAIGNAQIQDAAISSAKIVSLVVDKITSGQLNSVIDVQGGIIRMYLGDYQLTFGSGFGQFGQYFMWFGPLAILLENLDDANALAYMKINGDAYFGGTLRAVNAITSSAQIANAIITAAKIGTAEVQTLNLAGQAVTIPVAAYTAGMVAAPTSPPGAWATIQSCSIVSTGNPLYVNGAAQIKYRSGGNVLDSQAEMRITRDGTVIYGPVAPTYWQYNNAGNMDQYGNSVNCVAMLDNPAAGAHTYLWEFRGTLSTDLLEATFRSLQLLEVKR